MMSDPRTYETAAAFRRALEERIGSISRTEQVDLNRLRRQASFDRLLARLFHHQPPPWALKGGYALELRFQSARSTIDIDLTVRRLSSADRDPIQAVREMLQEAAGIDLGDWFEYRVGSPVMDLAAAPYGGARYPVEARMDRRIFSRFHVDAGIGDVLMDPLEIRRCRDWLGFAGIEASEVAMIPREQQAAEKIHAYSLPRLRPNSRVKDLVDLALLIGSGGLDQARLIDALRLTFDRRKTHELPSVLLPPPAKWQTPFAAVARECGLSTDLVLVFAQIRDYLESIISKSSR
jgi:hypothetical protein